jgi:hypothetical protein
MFRLTEPDLLPERSREEGDDVVIEAAPETQRGRKPGLLAQIAGSPGIHNIADMTEWSVRFDVRSWAKS